MTFSVLRPRNFSQRHNLLYGIGLITDYPVTFPGIEKILKHPALVAVLVIKGIFLRFPYRQIGKRPHRRACDHPPIPRSSIRLGMRHHIVKPLGISVIICYVGQSFLDKLLRCLPLAHPFPTDRADIAIFAQRLIIDIIAGYYALAQQFVKSFPDIDDITGLQHMAKIPHCPHRNLE